MPSHSTLAEAYDQLKIECWSTWQEGATREQALPRLVVADYCGTPCSIRVGAFLGWRENKIWWVDLATRLGLPSLKRFGLLDIEHQAGGHSCVPWFCVAAPVAVRSSQVGFVEELCRHYFHAHGGWMDGSNGKDGRSYRERLNTAGLTASGVSDHLLESVYPMDATHSNLHSLLARPDDALRSLEPLISDKAARDALEIYIIADNSD